MTSTMSRFCIAAVALLLAALAARAAEDDVLIADFDGKDYGTWKVEGEAFGPGPAQGTLPHQMPVSGYLGHGLVNSMSNQREAEEIVTTPLYRETWRPQFHFTAAKNWLNDPNGCVFYKGEWHLFFQHNPVGLGWGDMTWGHAVSPDLVHWEQLPNAIEPDAFGQIWSGSAVVDWNNTAGFQKGDEKTLVAIYTAAGSKTEASKGKPFTQCITYSTDRGRTWTKYEKNPVLGHVVGENRDPKLAWHAPTKQWIMALFKDGDTYAFFASPDLKAWTHLEDHKVPGCGECPDFFEMPVDGDKSHTRWVFTAANGRYFVGTFDGKHFAPETKDALPEDWGANYYAVQTWSDVPPEEGRRIQIAWMNGGQYPKMPFNQQMSFPCELKLRAFPEGLRICRTPVKEIERLHDKEFSWKDVKVETGKPLPMDIPGDLFDIRAEIDVGDAAEVVLKFRGESIRYVIKDKKLTCLGREGPLEPVAGRIQFQVLVDRTSIEVFGNDGRLSMTSCFLPRDRSQSFSVVGGAAKLVSLKVWTLKSAWGEGGR